MSASLVGSEMCIRDRHQGAVQLGAGRPWNAKVVAADVIERLANVHDGEICVPQQRVHAKGGVVGLCDSGRSLRA
eukprot:13604742-Alexandrium_andersonii.AAC.1